ncbi:hypothetical protein BSL78_06645 [Apostichopus japonicus]|uniref:Leucine-rich repeat and IQ domain-containing protein 1 n=1 Tax=Stichopus japonicus TaxID=307972 RepID=A0A2G8L808_STIJA|nr:hypothetical protein BSL78_06645 [Apostichopus japonicus]
MASEFMNIHDHSGDSQQTSELTVMRNEGTRMESVVNSTVVDESDMSRDGTLKDGAMNIHRTNDNLVGKQRELEKEDMSASPSVEPSVNVAKRDKATSQCYQENQVSSYNREGESSPEGKKTKTNNDTQKLIGAPNEYSPTMECISDGNQPVKTDDRSNKDMNYSLVSNLGTALAGKEQHEYSSVNENIEKVQSEEGTNPLINDSKSMKESTITEKYLSERNGSDLERDLSVDKQGGQRAGDDLSSQGKRLGGDGGKKGVPSEISQSEMEHEIGNKEKDGASIDKGKRGVLNSETGDEEVTSPRKAVVAEKGNLPEELEKARRKWMETSTSFSKQLIKAKDRLRNLEKEKRKYLRRPSALKKMAAISEEKLLEASLVALTLAEVTTVELVNLPGCTLKTLNECPRLNTIRCRSSAIQGLEGFDNSPDVTFIDFKGNQLSSVNCRDLQDLTYLDLSSNKLSSVHGLEGCSSLKWLDLSNNKISRLDGVEYLLLLSHLDVSNNQLINCQSLSSLVHLISLNLSNNHLSTVPELDSCPLLQSLKFTDNSISEFPSLSNHVMVIELLLDNNSLISMETMKLSWLPRLEYLSLAQNSLSIIPVLNFAFSLKKLDLRNNYITGLKNAPFFNFIDLQSLSAGLSKLPYLKSLYIDGNPVTEELSYKNEISKLSPSLVSLDNDECESTASSHPSNQFQEMCHSQIVASRALKERHGTVVRSIQPSKNQLHKEAVTWSAYLEYSLKMAVDHRYMHEYGDLSPVTCSMSDLCRMIPDLNDSPEGHLRFEENRTKSENIPSSDNSLSEKRIFDDKEGSIYESDQTQKRDKQFDAKKLVRSQLKSIEESSEVAKKKFEKDKADKVETNLFEGKDKEDQTETSAAIKIQSVWRGFKVRQDIEVHSRQYLAVLMIQALWRGYAVKEFRKAGQHCRIRSAKRKKMNFI